MISAIGIIWPSQAKSFCKKDLQSFYNSFVKAQSNDHAGTPGNGHPRERDPELKKFHLDNGKKKNLMLSYI